MREDTGRVDFQTWLEWMSPGLNDSKQLKEKALHRIYNELMAKNIPYGLCFIHSWEIDRINIARASMKAMKGAVEDLCAQVEVDSVLIDGQVPLNGTSFKFCEPIVRGDELSNTIAAGSIIAKVHRDWFMKMLDVEFPAYGFGRHKGYGTVAHDNALKVEGPCDVHRQTFKPIAKFYLKLATL